MDQFCLINHVPSGHSLNLSLSLFDCEMDVIPKVSAGDQVLERPLKYFVSNRTWVSVRILIVISLKILLIHFQLIHVKSAAWILRWFISCGFYCTRSTLLRSPRPACLWVRDGQEGVLHEIWLAEVKQL